MSSSSSIPLLPPTQPPSVSRTPLLFATSSSVSASPLPSASPTSMPSHVMPEQLSFPPPSLSAPSLADPISTFASLASPPGGRVHRAQGTTLQSAIPGMSRNSMDDVAAVINARGEHRRLASSLNNHSSSPQLHLPSPPRLPLHPRTRLYTGPLSDEEAWWIVIEGEQPGVYQGR